jgi:transcription elongation factor/antiterminator RfaH
MTKAPSQLYTEIAAGRYLGGPLESNDVPVSLCLGAAAADASLKYSRQSFISPSKCLAEDHNTDVASSTDLKSDLVLSDNERWFLVHTQTRKELQARMHLGVQGFRTYLPQYLRTVRHARQLRTIRAPLFPSYLFIILDLGRDRWHSVRSSVGVSLLIGCDDRPHAVPHGIVESLIAHANEANLTLFGDCFRKGQKVRIVTGPFAESIGTLDRLDDSGRVRVLLKMMGSEISVSLQRSGLVPAK